MFAAQRIPYQLTGAFNKIVLDYLEGAEPLASFYENQPTLEGVRQAVLRKQGQAIDRTLLHEALLEQYRGVQSSKVVDQQIRLLQKPTTFTVCTAHQPNLFTGPLYFIYKILHAIKLANELKQQLPDYDFVPVYYMGSEDADLAELNHFYVEGKRYEWATPQTGAVGRMQVDKKLLALLEELGGQLSIYPYGREWVETIRSFFKVDVTIQEATFQLVHHLFADLGLVVLIADQPVLKAIMRPVFEEDLFNHTPSQIVSNTGLKLNKQYTEQAHARDINLFYFKDAIRERIERKGESFIVCNTDIMFSNEGLKEELQHYPERFSPNVILRGLYQESILPNVAFIGGGGEIAYWLQLKDLFQHYKIPYPVLVLRNSFLIMEKKWQEKVEKLGLTIATIFQPINIIINNLVQQRTTNDLSLNGKLENANALYNAIYEQALHVDPTLARHVAAIKTQAIHRLKEVEKKMLRAEKRKFSDQQRQLEAIKSKFFPENGLQERIDNIGYYYAQWGQGFITALYEYSLGLEQTFTVLTEKD
ncbi:MAG TPA: bacillithiol biosynthesis cysteine-adding enzyme BshC [Flavisolibacter sp.]|nr:bacillithiol biosynthesis cysteine-adding enzyme BshC [Flavisolibacter sp.]